MKLTHRYAFKIAFLLYTLSNQNKEVEEKKRSLNTYSYVLFFDDEYIIKKINLLSSDFPIYVDHFAA